MTERHQDPFFDGDITKADSEEKAEPTPLEQVANFHELFDLLRAFKHGIIVEGQENGVTPESVIENIMAGLMTGERRFIELLPLNLKRKIYELYNTPAGKREAEEIFSANADFPPLDKKSL